ncbi:MAG: sigma-54-dependent Fis family transcriptional regulator, partial [Spirochaetes bacterium]|nr:sigma-54-dependent Fis family transcriptional regulator [Spirochaetota bacterium]
MARFLLINRDREFSESVSRFYNENDHEVKTADNYSTAIDLLEKWIFDVVIFDTSIQDQKPFDFVSHMKKINRNTIVVITSVKEKDSEAIEAIDDGAYDFIQRPCSLSELEVKVNKAMNLRRLRQEAANLRGERNIIYKTENFIGESPEIKKVFKIVGKVARSSSTILLTGETGTGKELVAGAIHYNSDRAGGAFVKVNCAALPEHLLESELFGHERGAFTGAERQRIGRFEQADGGSIFLDEIGDM